MQPVFSDAEDALKRAKITLMMQKNTTFYTTILFSLKQFITEDLPTAATDGKSLLINPKFFMDLDPNERLFLLAHEVLHVALDHMHRIGNRDPEMWNIAADYVINGALVKAGYVMPVGGLYDRKYDGMTTEEVYNLLDKQQKAGNPIKPCNGGFGADIKYPSGGPGDVSQDDVTEIILRATTQAKAMGQDPGSLPGEIAVQLEKTLHPPLPWNVILQNYFSEINKDDYSFRRPNRRFLPDHYLPCAYSEAIANIAIILDLSCSVNDHEINTFVGFIHEIQQTLKPKKITVVVFDTEIKSVHELTPEEDPFKKLKFKARGGTSIAPVHVWIAENKPTVSLIFTDGEFTKTPPVDKNSPLIWLIHDDPKWTNDFGKVIHYDIPPKQ